MKQTAVNNERLGPPLKWHGGKFYLAGRIVGLMPRHRHYVEAYAGGLAVLLARDPDDPALWLADTSAQRGVSELVNDLDGRLTDFWRVLRDEQLFPRFLRQVQAILLSRREWEAAAAHVPAGDRLADAVAFFVHCRQSLAGRRKSFTAPTRTRTRRGGNGNVSEWQGAIEGLPAVHARLQRVFVENLPALALVRREDTPETLFYLDPPYFHPTRTARKVYGAFEMTEADHRQLLNLLPSLKGKVILSGYANGLYDTALASWTRHTFDLPNNAAGGKEKRRMSEVLWCNF
jgi:DNA adenine methylase